MTTEEKLSKREEYITIIEGLNEEFGDNDPTFIQLKKAAKRSEFINCINHKVFNSFCERIKAEHRYGLASKLTNWFGSEEYNHSKIDGYTNLREATTKLLGVSDKEYEFLLNYREQSFGRGEMLLAILFGELRAIKDGDYLTRCSDRPVEVKYLHKYNEGAGLGRSYTKYVLEDDTVPYNDIQHLDESYKKYKRGKELTPQEQADIEKHKKAQRDLFALILEKEDFVFVIGDEIVRYTKGDTMDETLRIEHDKGYNVKIYKHKNKNKI